jgi:hypothetical protein
MAQATSARKMPPWGAQDTDECKPPLPWKRDARLSSQEIATIAAWQTGGAPEGDPADAPKTSPAPRALSGVDVELAPQAPFVASGDTDEFRCFVLDPQLTEARFLNGIDVVPGNPKVVHHAVLFTDPHRVSASLAQVGQSFECGGGTGMLGPDQIALNVWTPGQVPLDYPSNIGTPMIAGTLLVLQIHYSPGGASAAPDTTRVQLRYARQVPDYMLFTTAIGNYTAPLPNGDGLQPDPDDRNGTPEFRIPGGATAHTETMLATVPPPAAGKPTSTVYLYGVMGHEHLAGVDVKVDLMRGQTDTCLIEDKWDFHWQRMYAYDAPVEQLLTVMPGDKIKVRCTYNDSSSNDRLETELVARHREIADIYLGEQTLDEMCLFIPQLLVRTPPI